MCHQNPENAYLYSQSGEMKTEEVSPFPFSDWREVKCSLGEMGEAGASEPFLVTEGSRLN